MAEHSAAGTTLGTRGQASRPLPTWELGCFIASCCAAFSAAWDASKTAGKSSGANEGYSWRSLVTSLDGQQMHSI